MSANPVRWLHRIPVATLLLVCMLAAPIPASAAPSGGDLLQACNESLRDGFESMIGKMCTWYVTPCDCNIDKSIPLVCLPESVPTRTLAGLVVSGLTGQPELQKLDAARAAAQILSAKYPCEDGQSAGSAR